MKPDLIILDEFQRFRDLLHADTEAGELAQELFEYSGADGRATRTLLLSATPYRMLTLAGDDSEEGDHYQDFIETLGFLFGRERGREAASDVARDMRAFRSLLQGLPQTREKAVEARKAIEGQLRQVMVRTERVSSTKERDSMLTERARTVSVSPEDLVEASAVSKVAEVLDAPEIVEYWKSSPYLLNFMRDYDLKKKLGERARAPGRRRKVARRRQDRRTDAAETLGNRPVRAAGAGERSNAGAHGRCLRAAARAEPLDSAGAPLLWRRTPRCAADEGARLLRLVHGAGRDRGDPVLRGREAGGCWRRSAEGISNNIACVRCSSGEIRAD